MRILVSSAVLFWLATGTAANLLFDDSPVAISILATLGLVQSLVGWLAHGGQRVSVPGVVLLSTGLFVYFPALYLNSNPIMGELPELITAVNVCFFGQLAAYYLWWQPSDIDAPPPTDVVDPSATRSAMWAGILLVAGGLAAGLLWVRHFLLDSAAFAGTLLYAVAAFRRPKPTMPGAYLVTTAMFVAYYLYIFDGFGRLTLGALAIGIVSAMAHRWPGRTVKASLVAALVPALVFLARTRVEFTATLNPNQSSEVTGLESVVYPLGRFAQLLQLERADMLDHSNGGSFWASAVALVPRGLWAEKPVGFGSELTRIFRPELANTGHSEAATSYGEWLYNFGLWGLVFMVLVFGFAVRALDRASVGILSRPLTRVDDFVVLTGLLILTVGVVDLIWGSSFTFVSRGGSRLAVITAIYILVAERKFLHGGVTRLRRGAA